MMYQNKLAVALKSARGEILREFDGDKVYIPFGSEYSVYLKNMHSRRAIAQISIDGKDIGDGTTFVVPAHGYIDVERFVKNGNLSAGNRFKFIERTNKVAAHRGVDVEDGLVRVTFQLEKAIPPSHVYCDPYLHTRSKSFGSNTKSFSSNLGGKARGIERGIAASTDVEFTCKSSTANEVGVTAAGSISEQQFTRSNYFPLEAEKTVMVLQLFGETEDNREVYEPVTVKTKPRCEQCGTLNRYDAKFCTECGAGLQIV